MNFDIAKQQPQAASSSTSHTTKQSPPSSLPELPNEILALILLQLSNHQSTLHQCILVTTQFYTIANPLLWKAPRLYNDATSRRFFMCLLNDTTTNAAAPSQQQQLAGSIRELRLRDDFWTNDRLAQILPLVPELTHLSIDNGAPITDHTLDLVPTAQLNYFFLDNGRAVRHDTTWIQFIKTHPHLERLDLGFALHMTDASLDAMAASLPPLRSLVLDTNKNITTNAIRRLIGSSRLQQQQQLVLEKIELYFCDKVVGSDFPEYLDMGERVLQFRSRVIHEIWKTQQQQQLGNEQ